MPSPVKILILDDEETVRNSLKTFLDDYDFETVVAESAEEALTLIEENVFKVAIVDIRLPGMNGISFIQKAIKMSNDLSFLIHTGSVEFKLSDEMILNPRVSNSVILKPVRDIEKFVDEIHLMVNRGIC